MAEPDRERMLQRRLYCEQTHLTYLQHISEDPLSAEAEVFRRYERIAELKKEIEGHLGHIARIEDTVRNTDTHIQRCKARMRSLNRELKAQLIQKYLAEYAQLSRRLERED